jgi:hypothetical protein
MIVQTRFMPVSGFGIEQNIAGIVQTFSQLHCFG